MTDVLDLDMLLDGMVALVSETWMTDKLGLEGPGRNCQNCSTAIANADVNDLELGGLLRYWRFLTTENFVVEFDV